MLVLVGGTPITYGAQDVEYGPSDPVPTPAYAGDISVSTAARVVAIKVRASQ